MSQGNPIAPEQSSPQANPAGASHGQSLGKLYKMSMTAGLGSTDYVAINVTSVVALVFGVASALSFLDNLLLVLPITGIILSIVALRQIFDSNGTQSGKILATVGLLLSLLLGGSVIAKQSMEALGERNDEQAISNICQQLGQSIAAQKFDDAYNLFDDQDFKARVPLEAFRLRLTSIQHGTGPFPPISSIIWNKRSSFSGTGDDRQAQVVMIVSFSTTAAVSRMDTSFRQRNGQWKISNIDDLFPPIK